VEVFNQIIQETLNPVSGGFFYDLMRVLSESKPIWVPVGAKRKQEISWGNLGNKIWSLFQYANLAGKIPPGTGYRINYNLKNQELELNLEFPPWYERRVSYHEPWSPKKEYQRLWKLAEEGEVTPFKELLVLFRRNNDFNGALYLFQLAYHNLIGWPDNKVTFELYEFAHGTRWEKYKDLIHKIRGTREPWRDPFFDSQCGDPPGGP